MKGIVKEAGKEPKIQEIETTWEWFHHTIGGYIETVDIPELQMVMLYNRNISYPKAPNLQTIWAKQPIIRGTVVMLSVDTTGTFQSVKETEKCVMFLRKLQV